MIRLLFQLVALHAALSAGFNGHDRRPPFGAGFSGDGGPPASLFPSCANTCFQKFHTPNKVGGACDIKDTKCICNDQQVQTGTSCCMANACNADDLAKAQKFVQGQCSPFGVTNAGVCEANLATSAVSAVTVTDDPVTVSQDPVTFSVPVPVTVSATLTSILLTTSILTTQSLVVVTSVETNTNGGAATTSTFVSSATSLELVTTVLSSTNVIETDTASTSFSNSISTQTGALAEPTGLLSSSTLSSEPKKGGLSSGAKAGIAITVLIALGILSVVPFWFWRRRKQILDREFQELKDAHDSNVARPMSKVVPLYPRAVVAGAPYRDIFDKPAGMG